MRALVITGDGVGNAVQSTPVFSILWSCGYEVDMLIPGAPKDIEDLFGRFPEGVKCSVNPNTFRGRQYDLVSANWMFGGIAKGFKAKRTYVGKPPIPNKISESYSHWSSLQDLMFPPATTVHKMPPTWVCSEWDSPDLGEGVHLALHNGSKTNHPWLMKRYPHYSKVIHLLGKWIPDLRVHVLGTDKDSWLQASLMAGAGGDYVEHRNLPLVKVAGLLRLCDAFVGNDAGLSHVSAAVGTPTAILYGPTEVRKNLPPNHAIPITSGPLACRPCHRRKIGHYEDGSKCQHECLQELDPEYVARVLHDLLEKKR